MNKQYRVSWEIDVTASSPKQAAIEACKIQRDPHDHANSFYVVCGYGTPEQDKDDARHFIDLEETKEGNFI